MSLSMNAEVLLSYVLGSVRLLCLWQRDGHILQHHLFKDWFSSNGVLSLVPEQAAHFLSENQRHCFPEERQGLDEWPPGH